jgi:multiple sugar transport system permease protein
MSEVKTKYRSAKKVEKVTNILLSVFMGIISLILIIPFLWMVVSSLQPTATSIFQNPPKFPEVWSFSNYVEIFKVWDFWGMLGNTLFVVFTSMILSITSSVLVAYGFARFRARGKKLMFMFMLSTMMLPWIVTLMPSYILFQKIGWTGTFLPLIVPAIGGGAFNIFLVRQYIMGIPKSLDEAAIMDGCNRFQILTKVLLPQCGPILATLVVFSFNGAWSDYVGPSIYLMGVESKYTLSVGLTILKNQTAGYGVIPWHLIMAGCVVFAMPMIIILFVAQDAFVRGVVTTGIKE